MRPSFLQAWMVAEFFAQIADGPASCWHVNLYRGRCAWSGYHLGPCSP
jgi:hypothetical protein